MVEESNDLGYVLNDCQDKKRISDVIYLNTPVRRRRGGISPDLLKKNQKAEKSKKEKMKLENADHAKVKEAKIKPATLSKQLSQVESITSDNKRSLEELTRRTNHSLRSQRASPQCEQPFTESLRVVRIAVSENSARVREVEDQVEGMRVNINNLTRILLRCEGLDLALPSRISEDLRQFEPRSSQIQNVSKAGHSNTLTSPQTTLTSPQYTLTSPQSSSLEQSSGDDDIYHSALFNIPIGREREEVVVEKTEVKTEEKIEEKRGWGVRDLMMMLCGARKTRGENNVRFTSSPWLVGQLRPFRHHVIRGDRGAVVGNFVIPKYITDGGAVVRQPSPLLRFPFLVQIHTTCMIANLTLLNKQIKMAILLKSVIC